MLPGLGAKPCAWLKRTRDVTGKGQDQGRNVRCKRSLNCVEDLLEEIYMIPRKQFKDLNNQGHVYMHRRRHDLGNYKYSVIYQFLVRLAEHHGQLNIKAKFIQLTDRYTSLRRASSSTQTGIEMRGDVIEYCLQWALQTGPAIPDEIRESRLSFNKALIECSDAYNSLIHGLCMHPPIVRECPPPDWFAKTISQADAAQTSRSKGEFYQAEFCTSIKLLSPYRQLNDCQDE